MDAVGQLHAEFGGITYAGGPETPGLPDCPLSPSSGRVLRCRPVCHRLCSRIIRERPGGDIPAAATQVGIAPLRAIIGSQPDTDTDTDTDTRSSATKAL